MIVQFSITTALTSDISFILSVSRHMLPVCREVPSCALSDSIARSPGPVL